MYRFEMGNRHFEIFNTSKSCKQPLFDLICILLLIYKIISISEGKDNACVKAYSTITNHRFTKKIHHFPETNKKNK